jgi:hypothetical protein
MPGIFSWRNSSVRTVISGRCTHSDPIAGHVADVMKVGKFMDWVKGKYRASSVIHFWQRIRKRRRQELIVIVIGVFPVIGRYQRALSRRGYP